MSEIEEILLIYRSFQFTNQHLGVSLQTQSPTTSTTYACRDRCGVGRWRRTWLTSCCARYACAPEVSLYSQRGSAISRLHMNGTSGVFNRRPLGGNVSVRSFQQAATGEFVNDRVHEHQHWDDIPNSAEMGRLELITAKSLEHPNTRRCTNRYYLLTTVFPSCRPGVACVLSSTFSLIPVTYHSCKLSVQCLMWSSWSTCFCFGQDGVLARLQDVSFWPVPAALPEKRGGIRDII